MRRRVVRTTTLVPLLLTTLALTLLPTLTAGPATAGGPTSVLLSSPTLGRTTSLYMTDSAYDALAKEVGAFSNGAGVSETPAKEPTGEAVTATWLIHDVQVWRVDRIFLDAAGGPWVASQEMLSDTGNLWDSPVRWSRAADGPALADLLSSLGLVQGAPEAPAAEPPAAEPRDAAAPASTAGGTAPQGREGDGASTGVLVLVGLLGLVLGAGLALVGAAVRTRRRDVVEPDLEPLETAGSDDFPTEVLAHR